MSASFTRPPRPSQTHSDGHPIAGPIGASSWPSSRLVSGVPSQSGAANDGAHPGTTPVRRRVRTADLDAIRERLSDRDWAVIRSVAEHQFLTGLQIAAFHFHDHAPASGPRIARRVLARLRALRVLGALERRVGGIRAGSEGLIHYVDVVGDQLLRGRSGRTARRSREPSARFVAHRLAVADAHLALVRAHRDAAVDLIDCVVEPAAWRSYTGPGGARLTLKADLYAETGAGDDLSHAWFIEVDLGTESIPTLLKKCRDFEAYRRTGTEQEQAGGFPIVVWSVTHRSQQKAADRRVALEKAIASDRSLPPQLFRVIAPQQLTALLVGGGQL
ncbi:replication-relaxation family protein [Mycolicibacterium grossiae]|uniref:Replication-relaxation n=1 Tax=Mycolicibacterium grossiae TaxID=1552759 RepID=A0A1E8QBG6_9MYCO|nr:replication-relaxation family protein [Mycolicibacterium grossiae]OFJ55641.1 hypothetical protein BEL07_00005 [Mycolicibacterium grossiae]QEM43525.1 hypothetical protein FZ046_00910 [Mycolicibacterium grossiae]